MSEETLFHLALEKPAHERSGFLDGACSGDGELRRRVERLLMAHDNPGSFLQQPVLQSSGASRGEPTQALDSGAAPREGGIQTQIEPGKPETDDLAFLTPSTKPSSLGRLEHYEILEVIGKGGFGTVLRAFDEKLHRIVAIKVLSPDLSASGTARQRFIREARTAAAVAHEHVVTIHAVVEDHRPPYLVMQLVDGVTLQQKLDKTGTLSLREILRIGSQMAQALDAAHKQGLVHRDIKPANILLENGVERVKITDFGLARAVDDASVTQSGTVAGTPMYMSPEQAEGLPIDHRSDLFSLGTVLYAMCTGHSPFRGSGTHAVLKRVIDAAPRPIREINNDIPDWLCAIIAMLHAKKPAERFQTAKEVAELLGQRLADVQAGRAIEIRAGSVSDGSSARRARRGSPDPAAVPDRRSPEPAGQEGDLRSDVSAGSGDPRRAREGSGDPRRARRRWVLAASIILGLVAAVGFYAFSGLFEHLPIDHPPSTGTLTVQTNEPVDLLIERLQPDPKVISDGPRAGGSAKVLWVAAGTYRILASRNDAALFLDTVRVNSDEQTHVTVIPEPGWTHLFNRKDLDGWTTEGGWSVNADGHLVSDGLPGAYAFTTRTDFKDFQLRAEFKVAGGAGGILLRSAAGQKPVGYRASLGGFPPLGTLMAALPGLDEYRALINGPGHATGANQWQTLEITVRGNRFSLKHPSFTFEHTDTDNLSKSGSIGLDAMAPDTVLVIKKIEIKELPPEDSGWVQIFNGKDFERWRPSATSKKHAVEDGCILLRDHSVVTYDRIFGDFHCRLQAKVNQIGTGVISIRWDNRSDAVINLGPGGKNGFPGTLVFHEGPEVPFEVVASPPASLVAADTWFPVEIIARGQKVLVKVNGTTTADATIAKLPREGALGLMAPGSAPGTVAHFKNIEIKELPPEEPGWVQLFNGKDLEGWNAIVGPDAWKVHAGLLHGTNAHGYLATKKDYADFHLRMEVNSNDVAQIYLGLRGDPIATALNVSLGRAYRPPGKYAPGEISQAMAKGGLFFDAVPDLAQPDRWYPLEVIAKGPQVTVTIHGKVAVAMIDKVSTVTKGPIALIQHAGSGPFRIRNIEIKELPPFEPGWVQLFNGKDFTNWKTPVPQGTWRIENAMLISHASGVMLRTQRSNYRNFHFRIEAQSTGGVEGAQLFRMNVGKDTLGNGYLAAMGSWAGSLSTENKGVRTPLSLTGKQTPNGTWYTQEVIAIDNRLVVKVNDKTTSDVTNTDHAEGFLGVRIFTGQGNIRFRKIEIKELPPEPATPAPKDEWVQLFDGTDLKPWVAERPEMWRVEDKLLIGEMPETSEKSTFLRLSDRVYGDFTLKMELRIDKEFAQINVRTNPVLGPWDTYRWNFSGHLYSSISKRYLIQQAKNDPLTLGKWHKVEMTAHGDRFIYKVDGKVIASCVDTDAHKHLAAGWLRMQIGPGTKIAFKKLEIKDLSNSPAPVDVKMPSEPGFQLLFNRQTLRGWTGDTTGWKVDNEALVADTKGARLLRTESTFQQFILRFDCWVDPAGPLGGFHFYVHGSGDDTAPYGILAFNQDGTGAYEMRQSKAISHEGRRLQDVNFKPRQWNPVEIRRMNGQIEVISNGKSLATIDAPGVREGFLALNPLDGAWKFRDLEIKRLPDEVPWTPLYDGKTTKGWTSVPPAAWTVKDTGVKNNEEPLLVLLGEVSRGDKPAVLIGDRDVGDFHLKAYLRDHTMGDKSPGNSIYLRTNKNGDAMSGYAVDFTSGWVHIRRASDDAAKPPVSGRIKKELSSDSYFTLEIIVRGPTIEVLINGDLTASYTDPEPKLSPARGRLALQVKDSGVEKSMIQFRTIEIKELPPDFQPLFNAMNLDGWTPHEKLPNNWKVENGILVGRSPNSYLFRDGFASDKSFHLRAETRINEGGYGAVIVHTDTNLRENGSPYGCWASINSTNKKAHQSGHLVCLFPSFQVDPGLQKAPPQPNEWFMLEVISQDGLITVKVNGEVTAAANIGGRAGGSEHIALHVGNENSVVEFRSITFKELP